MSSRYAAATLGSSALLGTAALAYAVRGRSSQIFGPSVYRSPARTSAIALTFDDGPSESTPELLDLLERSRVPATFFQCGANVRRLPAIAHRVAQAGHEIGNHSDTHPAFYFRSASEIYNEFDQAQRTIEEIAGVRARLMRAPYGVRWFGFREMQERLQLLGVMWTIIGRDWTLDAERITRRVLENARPGAIICLHDGRELLARPDIRQTVEAVRRIVPALESRFEFRTVSGLLAGD